MACGEVENFTTRQLLWSLANSLQKLLKSTELGRSYSPPELARFFWTTVYIGELLWIAERGLRPVQAGCPCRRQTDSVTVSKHLPVTKHKIHPAYNFFHGQVHHRHSTLFNKWRVFHRYHQLGRELLSNLSWIFYRVSACCAYAARYSFSKSVRPSVCPCLRKKCHF